MATRTQKYCKLFFTLTSSLPLTMLSSEPAIEQNRPLEKTGLLKAKKYVHWTQDLCSTLTVKM